MRRLLLISGLLGLRGSGRNLRSLAVCIFGHASADTVDEKHQEEEGSSQDEGELGHVVIEASLALERRANTASTRHGVPFARDENQDSENDRDYDREKHKDVVGGMHLKLITSNSLLYLEASIPAPGSLNGTPTGRLWLPKVLGCSQK